MAGKVRYLLEREGRYFARVVVPKKLRAILGKHELREALGGDRREALRKLPAASARLLDALAAAEARLNAPRIARTLTLAEIAVTHYAAQLADDEAFGMQLLKFNLPDQPQ